MSTHTTETPTGSSHPHLTAQHGLHIISLAAAPQLALSGEPLPDHMKEPTRAALDAVGPIDGGALVSALDGVCLS